jgi:glycine betaine/choline ABC-type transport system substrate-binding protein
MRIYKGNNYAIKGDKEQYVTVERFTNENERFVWFQRKNYNKAIAYKVKQEWLSLKNFKKFIDESSLLLNY